MVCDDGGLFAGSLPGSPAFRHLHSYGCRWLEDVRSALAPARTVPTVPAPPLHVPLRGTFAASVYAGVVVV